MGLAIIAVILILIFASWWSSTPDIKTKGNPNFHQESFDKPEVLLDDEPDIG